MNKKNDWIKQRDFLCKDIWARKTGTRPDGSAWSLQKIINDDDHNLLVWDNDELGITIGDKYSATGIRIKQSRDGFDEWHTGKFSTIGPIDPMDKLAPQEKIADLSKVNQPKRPRGVLVNNTDEKIVEVLARLIRMEQKFDDLTEMI